jgi:hypothetical protein
VKNPFFLVIPKRQNIPQRVIEFEAKALQHWISELPAGNPGLATRLIHDFLIESNTIELPVELRLDMLERIRLSVLTIEDSLRQRLIKSGFPKEENDHKILNVLVSIEKEFAIGYWIVVKELTQRQVGWLQGKNVALALQRCIMGLSSVVISHFIMGMPVPDWIWIDLHALYQMSVKFSKETSKVVMDPSRPNQKTTLENSYKQILLLSLADPTGLMQKEITQVYDFIETISSLVDFHCKPVAGQPIQCLIFTDEDKPPLFQTEAAGQTDTATLYIDFTKLYKVFEQKTKQGNSTEGRFSSMQTAQSADKPAAELLDYLKQRWSGLELQSSQLFNDRLDRYFAIGLASAYALKNSTDAGFESPMEFLAESKSDNLLSCQFEQTGILSVGSLISFRSADRIDDKRSIGVINKIIVNKQNNKIHFGVQLLTPHFVAVQYSLPNASKKDELQKALFYSLIEADGEKTYIITDSFLLKEGDVIRIFWKSDDFPAALNKRKNIGLGYWQFGCVRLEEKEKQDNSKKGYDFI